MRASLAQASRAALSAIIWRASLTRADASGQPVCRSCPPTLDRSCIRRVRLGGTLHLCDFGETKQRGVVFCLIWRAKSSSPTTAAAEFAPAGQMKPYIALWFFLVVLSSAMLTAHSQACRTERQQCSPRNACCEGLACAPMFLDEKNPQLFYGNCLQSVPSSLSRAEPPKPERPPFSPRGPVLRDRQR